MDSFFDKFASLRAYEITADETVIRRYLDCDKFHDLLISRELHLSPASVFLDLNEGCYTALDHQNSEDKLRRFGLDVNARKIADKQDKPSPTLIAVW